MSLTLHQAARAAIVGKLTDSLPKIIVRNGCFLDSLTVFFAAYEAEQSLPKNGLIHDSLVKYVDENPLIDFIKEYLQLRLIDGYDYESDPESKAITDIKEFSNATELAESLVARFTSLPWEYTVSLELPPGIVPAELFAEGAIAIGEDERINVPDLLFAQDYPLDHPNEKRKARALGGGLLGWAGLAVRESKWETDRPYLMQNERGIIGIYGGGSPMERCAFNVESFLGLGLSTRLLTYKLDFKNPDRKLRWTVHEKDGDKWQLLTRFDFDEEANQVVRHIRSFQFADSYAEEKRLPWLRQALEQIRKIVMSEENDVIRLAAKWYFDSHRGKDSTLRYIRLMTTLEILLGEHLDRSKVSLGDLLGNRLAYLIGENHKQRSEIIRNFKKIYSVRSSILHHGKHKLKLGELQHIRELDEYCRRAIEKEVSLHLR